MNIKQQEELFQIYFFFFFTSDILCIMSIPYIIHVIDKRN